MPPPHRRYLAWKRAERERLRCAACNGGMLTYTLWDVHVDRCKHHGVWFDANELRNVLLRGAKPLGPSSSSTLATPGQAGPANPPRLGGGSRALAEALAFDGFGAGGAMVGSALELIGDLISSLDLDG
ncbi:MAG: zf-TFIIB domain-containing protein [Kofleriaceae bacterium]